MEIESTERPEQKSRRYPPPGMIAVFYFSTKNRISPFVALVGDWPDRAAMIKTVRAGTNMGWRPAIPAEIELLNKSTRHVAITWRSVRDVLWTHRSPDLDQWYPAIVGRFRKHSRRVKENLAVVQGKINKKTEEKAVDAVVVAENKAKERAAADKQLKLFEAA